jgi:hypothetical protein
MKAFAVALSKSRSIPALLGLVLLSACTEQHAPKVANIVVGSNVALNNHALACEKPSDELNQVADSNGAVQNDIVAKVAHRKDCHDSGAFLANGQWRVLAINDKQLRIKMRGYLGEYWVSRAQVVPIESAAKPGSGATNTASLDGPVTLGEWRKSLETAFKQSSTEKPDDGVTKFFALVGSKTYAFGKYDAFNKIYLFTPQVTQLYGEFGPAVRSHVLVSEGRPPVIVVSPLYWARDEDGDLSMRKMAVLVDGELIFERTFQASDVKRGRFGAGVEESTNVVLSESELNSLRKITKDSHISIRLTGNEGYVNLKKRGPIDPVSHFRDSIIDSLSIYDSIKNATAGHMPDQPSSDT